MAEGWRPGTPPLAASDVPAVFSGCPALVVYFWAPWNGVDRLFSPVLDAVRPEFEGRIEFRSADLDEAGLAAFCEECEVVNVPALACYVGDRRVKTVVGSRTADELRAEFAALLGEPATPSAGSLGWLSSLWRRRR